MTDQDHRCAAPGQGPDGFEQPVRFARRKHGGGFVENQYARVAIERLDDLDALLRADAESADDGVGIERKRVSLGKPAHPPRQRVDRQPPTGQPVIAQDHVLGHGKRGDQEEMLMHHADA